MYNSNYEDNYDDINALLQEIALMADSVQVHNCSKLCIGSGEDNQALLFKENYHYGD